MDPSQNDSFGSFSNGQGGYVGQPGVYSAGPVVLDNGGRKKSKKWAVVLIVFLVFVAVAGGVFVVWRLGQKGGNPGIGEKVSLADVYYEGSESEWRDYYNKELAVSEMPDLLKMFDAYRELEDGDLLGLIEKYDSGLAGRFISLGFDSADIVSSTYVEDYNNKMEKLIHVIDEIMRIYSDAGCDVVSDFNSECNFSEEDEVKLSEISLEANMLYDEVDYVVASAMNYYEQYNDGDGE